VNKTRANMQDTDISW